MPTATKVTCPVCTSPLSEPWSSQRDLIHVECTRCGSFETTHECLAIMSDNGQPNGLLNSDAKKAAVGHWLRLRQHEGLVPLLDGKTADSLAKKTSFPSLSDQRENLLRWIGSACEGPGEKVNIKPKSIQYTAGAPKRANVDALIKRLEEERLIEVQSKQDTDGLVYVAKLTFNGWLAYEELASGRTSGRRAFMAMPFNKPDLDSVWYPALQKAIGETGFTLRRVDEEPKPGLIDIRMQVQIKEARFLMVELTHANNGAYWEAGFATGLGKPVIYTIRKGEKPHFDVEHWLRIEWDPANIGDALGKIKATVRNALPDALADPE